MAKVKISRRDALKTFGVAGVGLAMAQAAGPRNVLAAVSDLDEGYAPAPHPYWWVKEVDQPTTEIDWDKMQRYGEWRTTRGSLKEYRGEAEDAKYNQLQKDNLLKWELENKPGYTAKDEALKEAFGATNMPPTFLGPQKAKTPGERGVPKYEGKPEENARMLRVAMRHMGASNVGFVLLEETTTKKLIYAEEPAPSKKKIEFEDVEVGYEEENRLVIPNKAKYVIAFTIQMSTETMKYGPTVLGSSTTTLSYVRLHNIIRQTQEFLRALGYQGYAASTTNGLGIAPAFAVLAGLGEMSRLNRLITPEHGPMVRCSQIVTDLPLAPSKPIDFGVMRFCKTCKTCAEMCPSGALSMDEEPTWDVKGPWNNPGHKAYFEDSVKCRNYWNTCGTNCGVCFSVCPYAADDEASFHRIAKATIATTGLLNTTLVAADRKAFPAVKGEPMKDPEGWWQNENLAELGIDTRVGGKDI